MAAVVVGETWFLDAGVLLRKDSNGIVTRLELVDFLTYTQLIIRDHLFRTIFLLTENGRQNLVT